jgi:hypothetical protein
MEIQPIKQGSDDELIEDEPSVRHPYSGFDIKVSSERAAGLKLNKPDFDNQLSSKIDSILSKNLNIDQKVILSTSLDPGSSKTRKKQQNQLKSRLRIKMPPINLRSRTETP